MTLSMRRILNFFQWKEAASDERIADIDGLVEVKSGEDYF